VTPLLDIQVSGAQETAADLRELDARLHAPATEPLTKIGEELAEIIRRQLRAGDFAPLAESTLEIRRRRGQSGSAPLIASGALLGSITHSADADEASAGSDLQRAAHQQFGFTTGKGSAIPGKVVPARPFALIDDSDAERFEDQLADFLLGEGAGDA
jgi:phage gpG-like protein